MKILQQASTLLKQGRKRKGTSLQHRLSAFFLTIIIFFILAFTVLLILFDITGSGRKAVYNYANHEISHIADTMNKDFGYLSVQGVSYANDLAYISDLFFKENNIKAENIAQYPELLEPLLRRQLGSMLSVMERNTCSGVFILLNATVKPDAQNSAYAKAGMFLKKTQPYAVQSVGVKAHYLRGPAQIARDRGIDLLGQWKMEFDISDEDFFNRVMETARENPKMPISRLYYWTGRVTLKGNSEAGFLLCVPLRSPDGAVFGVCGIEVSDRMFKHLYSPNESNYESVFTFVSPSNDSALLAGNGLTAGNYYLTDNRIRSNLLISFEKNGFYTYSDDSDDNIVYGGLHSSLRLYPSGSPYENETWSVAVMMPNELLEEAINGRKLYLMGIVSLLLIISLCVSVFISKLYLRPVNEAIDTIKNKKYFSTDNTYLEINDLMEFLARQDEEVKKKPITITDKDADLLPMVEEFMKNIKTLSPAEKNVFDLYIKGYKAQEIADELYLSINTIKTHNRRIFTKLNVSSRKELLVYIDMMKEMNIIHD